jgi:DNA topoisomerase-1
MITLENIDFPGYMIVYDNTLDSETENTNQKSNGFGKIKVKDKMIFNSMKITEEYTTPPLRYNEASLVRYLEKNGIGRPSTYASIISKVIERNYVEIKDIDGIAKNAKILELNDNFKIKESTKEIYVGKEKKKIVPTSNGIIVNEFMMKHFDSIMDIEFTANFESYLDKIADGKANYVTILQTFYDMFNPIVEKLMSDVKGKKKDEDKLLGTDSDNNMIYSGTGKYGPYVKIMENEKIDQTVQKFDKKIIEAAEKKLNVSIWRPGGWDLNFVNYYKEDWFIVEIRLILQHAFYCLSGDEAIELITLDPELSKLVKKAKLIRPPELSNHIYF